MSEAGNQPTEKRGYYSHYLERIPGEKRSKIQQEIQEGHKAALTVSNVIKVFQGVEWRYVGLILKLPSDKLDSIAKEQFSDKQCEVAVVSYWLFIDPLASWRRIIDFLDDLPGPIQGRADWIRHYAEDLADTSLTYDNIAVILGQNISYGHPIDICLHIPERVVENIARDNYGDSEEQKSQSLQYWLDYSPYTSWSIICGRLLWLNENRALEVAKKFIKTKPEPTLTLVNLSIILDMVSDLEHVASWLAIPTMIFMLKLHSESRKTAKYFLIHHPAPSWKIVSIALWRTNETKALEEVRRVYLTNSELEIQRKLEVCRRAIKDKGSIDQIMMQGVFFGLPRSGKTSVKKRLVGKKLEQQQPSTGVAEKVTRVEIGKSMVQFVSRAVWNEIFDLNDEATIVVKDIADHIDKDDGMVLSTANVVMKQPSPLRAPNLHHVVDRVKKMFVRKRKTTTDPHIGQQDGHKTHHLPDPMHIFSAALHSSRTYTLQYYGRELLQWTIYLSDVGGQPEFQEMLPALVSGPSLYFLTFPLHNSLNEKYIVEYLHPGGSSIVPFEASFTVKECLLSSLASIASTRSYTKVSDGKAVTPKVLFIATHKDKIHSEETISQIDRELQEAVRKTAAFRENMIEFCSEFQMIFALNNMSSSEDDIQLVRDAVERIGTRNDDYKIQTPYTWMIFAITLRHYPSQVIKIDECFKIGKLCGIATREELFDALWFLHHNVGIIRHHQEVPDLQDVVIKDPQYIFDKMTKMIIITFTFESVGSFTHEEFVKKGIIPSDMLDTLSTESDDLSSEKFKILLEHLNLITPIEENGKVVKYFVPSALSHAELPPKTDASSPVVAPSIMITFESGYVPKGIFSSLVVKLLKKDKMSPFEWRLNPDRIYRNQLTLSIGPYADLFVFTLSPTHIVIEVSTSPGLCREITVGRVCCDVIREVKDSIRVITQALHYTQKAAHSLAFACPESPSRDHSHAANINFSPEGKALTLTCPFTLKTSNLPKNHQIWFDEKMDLPMSKEDNGSTVTSKASASSHHNYVDGTTDQYENPTLQIPSAHGTPIRRDEGGATMVDTALTLQDIAKKAGITSVEELDQECSQQLLLNLAKLCVDWRLIALNLQLNKGDVSAIDGDNRTVDEKRIGMLLRWRDKFSFTATYRALIEALLACGRTSDAFDACTLVATSGSCKSHIAREEAESTVLCMSRDEFMTWLLSKGVSETDCRVLTDSGITPGGFPLLHTNDIDELELTVIGKILVKRALREVKET